MQRRLRSEESDVDARALRPRLQRAPRMNQWTALEEALRSAPPNTSHDAIGERLGDVSTAFGGDREGRNLSPLAARAIFILWKAAQGRNDPDEVQHDIVCALQLVREGRLLHPYDTLQQLTTSMRALCVWARGAPEARTALKRALLKLLKLSDERRTFADTEDAVSWFLESDEPNAIEGVEDALSMNEAKEIRKRIANDPGWTARAAGLDDEEEADEPAYGRRMETQFELPERLMQILNAEGSTRHTIWRNLRAEKLKEQDSLPLNALYLFWKHTLNRSSGMGGEQLYLDQECAARLLSEDDDKLDVHTQLGRLLSVLFTWARDIPDAYVEELIFPLRSLFSELLACSPVDLPQTRAAVDGWLCDEAGEDAAYLRGAVDTIEQTLQTESPFYIK